MQKCPQCNRESDMIVTNIRDGTQFCPSCAPSYAPTFLPHFVLTVEDIVFFKACGIDPQVPAVLLDLVNRLCSRSKEGADQ